MDKGNLPGFCATSVNIDLLSGNRFSTYGNSLHISTNQIVPQFDKELECLQRGGTPGSVTGRCTGIGQVTYAQWGGYTQKCSAWFQYPWVSFCKGRDGITRWTGQGCGACTGL
jgi:hypothetical protein